VTVTASPPARCIRGQSPRCRSSPR
jgi:hypothetical protein